MAHTITLSGINQAVTNLEYKNARAYKYRLVQFILKHYDNEAALKELAEIDQDSIISYVWEIENDSEALHSKRRNLISLRSSINNDLNSLYSIKKNPEGIIISPTNIFEMSDQAKSNLLHSFTNSIQTEGEVDLNKISEVLKVISDFLAEMDETSEDEDTKDIIEKIKAILKRLSKNIFDDEEDEDEEIDVVELDEDEDIEEIEVDEDEEIEKIEIDDDEDLDVIELDEDEDIEEIEVDEDEEIEEIEIDDDEDLDVIELDEDDDIEEIEIDEDEEIEKIEIDDDEDLDVIELDEDEDIEEIEVDEDEEIEEIEIDDDEDLDVIELDEDEDIEEIEIDEDEEIEEIEIDDDEDLDVIELDEDEDIEEIELADDEVIEDIEGGLPIEDDQEEFKLDDDGDTENKKRLSEQFESYLGAMEKFYNQYLRVSAGKYIVGTKHPKPSEIEEQTFFTPEIYVGKFPVTNALFEVFVNKTGYITTAEKRGYGNVYSGKFQKKTDPKTGITKSVWNATYKQKTVNGACWYQPFGPGSNLHNKKGHPVVQISLDDANMFAAWIGKRLPSEFEWEAAARTEKGYILPWGDEWENEKCNTENLGIADTTSVETFIDHENALGICDTIGNVLEWTVNECVPPYFSNKNSAYYIAKGGSFISDNTVRLYTRFMFKSDFTSNILGFRCVAD